MNRKQRGMKRLAAAILVLLLLMTTAAVPAALAETFSAIVTAEEMLVYRDAKLQAQAGTLPRDTVVRVKSYSGKAAKISYSGKTGYAPVSDMKALDDVAKKAVVNTDAKMYKKPGGDGKAQKVKKGAKVYVITWSGKWARVEQDGSVGYMKLSALTKADDNWQTAEATDAASTASASETAQKGTVTLETLPVYKKANAKSGKVCTLKQGQVVDVLKWNTKWARVSVDGSAQVEHQVGPRIRGRQDRLLRREGPCKGRAGGDRRGDARALGHPGHRHEEAEHLQKGQRQRHEAGDPQGGGRGGDPQHQRQVGERPGERHKRLCLRGGAVHRR